MLKLKNLEFNFYIQKEIPYLDFLALQNELTEVAKNDKQNSIIICNHSPLLTDGRGDRQNKNNNLQNIIDPTIEYHKINRGGGLTFHGPNQVIIYPIIKLNQSFGLNKYLEWLQNLVINILIEKYDIKLTPKRNPLGLWIDQRKYASIGVEINRFVTNHGLALNVEAIPTKELGFDSLSPCGLNSNTYDCINSLNKEITVDKIIDDLKSKIDSKFYTIRGL